MSIRRLSTGRSRNVGGRDRTAATSTTRPGRSRRRSAADVATASAHQGRAAWQPARGWRRPASWHRSPAAARGAEGGLRRARLLRRLGARTRAERAAHQMGAVGAVHTIAMGPFHTEVSSGDARPPRAAAAPAPRGTIVHDEPLGRLLLRRSIPMPPVVAGRSARRIGRGCLPVSDCPFPAMASAIFALAKAGLDPSARSLAHPSPNPLSV
jgi:hypothetical protein